MPDMDEENQACMVPTTAPPTELPAAASAEPHEPHEGVRLSTPDEATEKAKHLSEAAESLETEKTINKMAEAAAGPEGGLKLPDRLGGALSLPGHALETGKGVKEIVEGDLVDGIPEALAGVANTTSDAAKIVGNEGVGGPASAIAGAVTAAGGLGQIARGIFGDNPAPGESSHDGATDIVSGIDHFLHGGADLAAESSNPWIKGGGEALKAGMFIGDQLAPVIFGPNDEKGSHLEEVPEDGKFNPSTGNGVVDWVFGTGKYTNGRFAGQDAAGAQPAQEPEPSSSPDSTRSS